MFDYESEIITAIRESHETILENIIKDTKEVYQLYYEIRQLLAQGGYILMKVFIGITTLFIALCIFFIQQHIYPLGILFFILAIIVMGLVIIVRFILSVDASHWIDCLRDDEALVMNRYLKAKHIEIRLKNQTIYKYLRHRHQKEVLSLDEDMNES